MNKVLSELQMMREYSLYEWSIDDILPNVIGEDGELIEGLKVQENLEDELNYLLGVIDSLGRIL